MRVTNEERGDGTHLIHSQSESACQRNVVQHGELEESKYETSQQMDKDEANVDQGNGKTMDLDKPNPRESDFCPLSTSSQ